MQVVSALRDNQITLVTNVKDKVLKKIARFTETVVVPTHELIDSKVVKMGSCEQFKVISNANLSASPNDFEKQKKKKKLREMSPNGY